MMYKNIYCLASLVFLISLFSSCSESEISGDPFIGGEKPYITLHISPLSLGSRADSRVAEKIKSLRIIMLSETNGQNYVEFNKYISFTTVPGNPYSGPGELANAFNYVFSRVTCPGKKKFYLIANEESVTAVNTNVGNADDNNANPGSATVDSDPEEPNSGDGNKSLTDILESYTANYIPGYKIPGFENGEGPAQGNDLESLMNSINFTPDYSITDGVIYLPYSAYYEGFEILDPGTFDDPVQGASLNSSGTRADGGEDEDGENENTETPDPIYPPDYFVDAHLWLVPAATKLNIEFSNFRKNPVTLEKVEIGGIAQSLFLNAQVDRNGTDWEKLLGDKKTYWIDWLAFVAESSKDYFPDLSENENFNKIWGWINAYTVPSNAYPENSDGSFDLLTAGGLERGRRIAAYSATGPGIEKIGPIYMPESRFIGESGSQFYELRLVFNGTELQEEHYEFTEQIGNLQSLFRNTNILIRITMNDWDNVGAYAEMQPWNYYTMNGFVVEEDLK